MCCSDVERDVVLLAGLLWESDGCWCNARAGNVQVVLPTTAASASGPEANALLREEVVAL